MFCLEYNSNMPYLCIANQKKNDMVKVNRTLIEISAKGFTGISSISLKRQTTSAKGIMIKTFCCMRMC